MRSLWLLLALCGLPFSAPAADAFILAPGRSVSIVDAADPSVRVVITAPADQALDVGALLPKQDVYSLATRMQVKQAGAIVRNADGSLSLGATSAATASVPTIENGFIVVDKGRFAHYKEAPAARAPAAMPIELLPRRDEIPFLGPIDLVGGGLVLPGTGLRIR